MVEDEERPWLHPYCDGGGLAAFNTKKDYISNKYMNIYPILDVLYYYVACLLHLYTFCNLCFSKCWKIGASQRVSSLKFCDRCCYYNKMQFEKHIKYDFIQFLFFYTLCNLHFCKCSKSGAPQRVTSYDFCDQCCYHNTMQLEEIEQVEFDEKS